MIFTQSIPPEQWLRFFNETSRRHLGWSVSVEVMRMDLGDQPTAVALALLGLSFETRGSHAGDIYIEAGDAGSELVMHHIDDPCCVRVADLETDNESYLQIESADGTTTLVKLRRLPALPPGKG